MARSIKKGPFVDTSLQDKIDEAQKTNSHKPIQTWSRRSMITPDFIGLNFNVHNGKKFDFLVPLLFPMGKLHLPTDSSKGDVIFKNRFCDFRYILTDGGRHLMCDYQLPFGKNFIYGRKSVQSARKTAVSIQMNDYFLRFIDGKSIIQTVVHSYFQIGDITGSHR